MDSGEENAYKVLKMCLFPPLWFINTITVHIYDMGWPNSTWYIVSSNTKDGGTW
jgi:hypothetical protein